MANYDFRKYLLNINSKNRRDFSLKYLPGELEITEEFKIVLPYESSRVIKNAAKDLSDFLLNTMDIGIAVVYKKEIDFKQPKQIILCTKEICDIDLKDAAGYMGYIIKAEENILICGYDDRGAAQGVYRIEDIMKNRCAPFIKREEIYERTLFSPRMIHSGFAHDEFPDCHLSQIAHSGMDAIIVYTRAYDRNAMGYMDLNDIIYRAEGYGLDVYAYSLMRSLYHPEDERAYGYYDSLYGTLFKKCPKLKGVILVGESIGFRSKDKRVNGLIPGEAEGNLFHNEKPDSAGFPCYDYPEWLELIKKVIRKENPDADIVLWTYNFNGSPKEDMLKLFNSMPKDISLLSTFEKPELIPWGDSQIACSDYTLSFEGPGENFLFEAKAAKEAGLKLYAMSNTGGLTWDIGTVPYLPCPYQWKKRYDNLKECREKYGLSGLMESHHYGFYPSFVSELAKKEYAKEETDFDASVKEIMASYFGSENADTVIKALKLWSEAITNCPPSVEDQYGPLRIGPSYPLSLNIHHPIAKNPYARFGGEAIVYTMYSVFDSDTARFKGRTPFPVRVKDDIKKLKKAIELMDSGVAMIEDIAKSDDSKYLVNLGKYMANTFRTVLNVKNWYLLKLKLLSCGEKNEMTRIAKEMHALALSEIENAKDTLFLVDFDSRLGWEPSMEYIGDREHIEIKIKQMEIMIEKELADYIMEV